MSEGKVEQVVYIASVGYSGSTLLNLLLGANPGITTLGEVYLLSNYARSNSRCTCGAPVCECPFWKNVEALLTQNNNAPVELAEFDLTPKNLKQSIFRVLPTGADLGLVLGNKRAWNAMCALSKTADAYRQCARRSIDVYDAACEIENSNIVVDSSKYALPLKSLFMELSSKLKIIYLVRDGHAVSKSLMKRQSLTFEQAAKKWARYNWNLQLIMRTIPKNQIYQLKYEDLCSDVSQSLNSISRFLRLPNPLEVTPLIKEKSHDIGGNPMRFRRSETEVKLDESWRQTITEEERVIFQKEGGALNSRLGYP